ncbi:MAG: RNA-binding protein [Elusimicrobia bacterium]|nr:RNA-binding protein [Elusimicrobiota bacterium]
METTKLYVGNLSYSVTESKLEELFSAHGTVKSVKLITDNETGRSKGFAFVEMSNSSESQKAIDAFNGTDLEGRSLKVNESRPKPQGRGDGYGKSRGGFNKRY